MLNRVYRLVAPRRIEEHVADVTVGPDNMLVRPTRLSICNADQRYWQGTRNAAVLAEKLPMALIHEAVGEVVADRTGTYSPGDMVAMVPNLPVETDPYVAENYLRSSKFRASSADGFMQELVVTNPDRCVELPEGLNPDVAAFTELVSVLSHIISRFDSIAHGRRDAVGFWGDGNVGFIGSLLFKRLYPESRVYVFGLSEDKLSDFTFADGTFLTSSIPEGLQVDHAFECAGGAGSEPAIAQVIDYIRPEGSLALCGVTENPVPINTRMVLEKGLRLFGSSRSGRADFERVLNLYREDPAIPAYLSRIVGQVLDIRSIPDMEAAFEADIQKRLGKTVMRWDA